MVFTCGLLQVPFDSILKKHKGIAYVDYDSPEAAKKAIEHVRINIGRLNILFGFQMNGKPSPKGETTLLVLPYQPINRGSQSNGATYAGFSSQSRSNLFVKNLPLSINETALAQLFSRFGPVRTLRIKRPDGFDPRDIFTTAYAIAYVNFDKEEDAAKAIAELNGQNVMSHILQIEYYDKS